MSFLTLHRHKPWHRASYLSLGGLSEDPLRRFLKEHKSIQRIAFCFDNDINKPENRGQEAAKRFMRQFSGKYITSILCPCKKDWNDVLRDKIQKRRVSMTPQQIIFLSIVGIALVALIFYPSHKSATIWTLLSVKPSATASMALPVGQHKRRYRVRLSKFLTSRKRGDTTKKAARLPQASSLI